MDNLIKKFNEELKYYFPESRLEAYCLKSLYREVKALTSAETLMLWNSINS